jgi:putative ABC transport system permease protein
MAPIEHLGPRSDRKLAVYGRLKPGVTIQQGGAELAAISTQLASTHPVENEGWSSLVRPLRDEFIEGELKLMMLTMMGAVTFVLLIACANVANLMLARATGRQREIAIRSALGAGRARMVRLLLTESVLLGLLGGALGIGVAYLGLNLLDAAMPVDDGVPYYMDWKIDRTALLYTMAISIATGLVFGLAPALQVSRGNLQASLKEGTRGAGASGARSRLRNTLVVAEVALSVVLLIGASLFVRTFMNMEKMDTGFEAKPLMTLRFYMPGERYEAISPKVRRVDDVIQRIEAIPGVEAAAASNNIPLSGGGGGGNVIVDGRDTPPEGDAPIFYAAVTAHWFKTLGIPMLRGRDFTDVEGRDSSTVAIVNEALAKKYWPNQDPIGRRFRLEGRPADVWFTVIGMTRNFSVENFDREEEPAPAAFIPYAYEATLNTGVTIRTSLADPAQIIPSVRREIRAADPILPVFAVSTMESVREAGYWEFSLFGWMFSIFGGIALILAAVGVYGVISYGVSQRTHEIGVRMALGAHSSDVLRLVVRQGVLLAGTGVALGLIAAFGVTRAVTSMLYGVSPTDPLSFIGIAVFLTIVAGIASYIPARRAMAVDPMTALRYE